MIAERDWKKVLFGGGGGIKTYFVTPLMMALRIYPIPFTTAMTAFPIARATPLIYCCGRIHVSFCLERSSIASSHLISRRDGGSGWVGEKRTQDMTAPMMSDLFGFGLVWFEVCN